MKHFLRKGLRYGAMAGLCVIAWTVQAQNTEPVAPPEPPATTAPAPAVEVEAPDRLSPPNVESNDSDARGPGNVAENVQERVRERFRNKRHRTDDRVAVGSNSTLGAGQHADSVVSVFGSSTSDGDVSEAVVSVFGDTRVSGSARDVVAVLGSVYLNGKASGDVVAVIGDVELGPQAVVDGELVVIGGTLKRDPAAIVNGQVQNVLGVSFGSFKWMRPWVQQCLVYLRPLALGPGLGWAWALTLAFLAVYVLIAVLFREPVQRSLETFTSQPGKTIVAALLATLLTPVILGLLLITIIGIPFLPLAALGIFLLGVFGKAVLLAWIGGTVLKAAGQHERLHVAVAVLIGGLIVTALYLVPVIGFIVYKSLGILGLGVAVYGLILAVREKRGGGGPAPAMAAAGGYGGGTTYMASDGTPHAASPASGGTTYSASPGGGGTFTVSPDGTASASGSTAGPGFSSSSFDESGLGAPPPPPGSSAQPGGGPSPLNPMPASSAASTYPRAGFAVRMGALFIDLILVAVLLGIVSDNAKAELLALATYGAIMWKLKGTTIGGMVFHLQVVRVDGRPIDWATATVRALSCFLSLVVAGLGFIWILFDEGRQAWHDKIAGTAVVRVPKGVSLL